jgi:hypothetical protein
MNEKDKEKRKKEIIQEIIRLDEEISKLNKKRKLIEEIEGLNK